MTRIIAISSGLARVGKTHLAVNLALEMSRRGRQVAVYNQTGPRSSIDDQLELPQTAILQRRSTDRGDSLVRRGYQGIDILSSGIPLPVWDSVPEQVLENIISDMDVTAGYDDFLVDTSGLDPHTLLACCRAASLVILVITPDARSRSEAFALLRILQLNGFAGSLHLLVNQVDQSADANELHYEFNLKLNQYLDIDVPLLGLLTRDVLVQRAEHSRQAFSSLFPDAGVSGRVVTIADAIDVAWPAPLEDAGCLADFWNGFRTFLTMPVSLVGGVSLEAPEFAEDPEIVQPQNVAEPGKETLLLQLDSSFHEFSKTLDSLPGLLQATAADVSTLQSLLQKADDAGSQEDDYATQDSNTLLRLAVGLVREIKRSVTPAQRLQLQVNESRVPGNDQNWLQAGCYLKYTFRFPEQYDVLLQIKSVMAGLTGFRQDTGSEDETIWEKVVADRNGCMNVIHTPGDSIRVQVWLTLGERPDVRQNSHQHVVTPVNTLVKTVHQERLIYSGFPRRKNTG